MIYQNESWRVCEDGEIRHRSNGYYLNPETLREKDWNGDWYHAPIHMAVKTWVDVVKFCDAWRVAIAIVHPAASAEWVVRTIAVAYQQSIASLRRRQYQLWYELDRGDVPIGHDYVTRPFQVESMGELVNREDWIRAKRESSKKWSPVYGRVTDGEAA